MVDRSEYLRMAIWGGATIAGILLLLALVIVYRRRYRAGNDGTSDMVWSLDDLGAMRRRGELSEAEYAHLRDRVMSQMGIERSEPPGLPRRSSAE